jgi:histidinol-phosphate/aromatic aminotransferase/cobyric acid decarboxylase-like protein/CTP:molybdopterin cytidylyltransferase MocA
MKAIILTAGYGKRMRPLTDHEHKTLFKINGRTIISRIIDGLVENDIRDIVVATGYLAQRLENYLRKNYPQINFTFVENRNYSTTNNIHSLSLVFDQVEIDDDILLIESDLIYEPAVIKKIIASPQDNVALVDKYRNGMDGTVVTILNQAITSIIPPHLQGQGFDFSDKYKTLNIYKFSQVFCNHAFKRLLTYYTSVIDQNSYYELILGILIYVQKATIYAAIIEHEKWAEIDDPNDLEQASFVFDKEERLNIVQQTCGGYWNYDILDFCYIRNMYFPTAAILSELKDNFENLICNYGSKQSRLNQKLAYFLLCDPQHLTLLNGCSQIYPFLRTLYSNQKVLLPKPSFGEFERIFPHADYYEDRVGISTEQIETRSQGCEMVVVVNPNNPTGSLVQTSWLVDFARRHHRKTILLDESFIEFAPMPSLIPYLNQNPLNNVVVIKSLSKVLGIPGLRLGFVYSTDVSFNDFIRQNLPIWNTNSVAECFLEIVLKYRQELKWSFAQTIHDREVFAEGLRALPNVERVFKSAGNFLLIKFKGNTSVWEDLPNRIIAASNIYVKDVSSKIADGHFYLRLAVRLPEENIKLITNLQKLIY